MAIIRSGHFDRIAVHHSAVKPGAKSLTELKSRAASYNTSHSKKEWANDIKTKAEFGYAYIEYHYMIARDGSLLQVQNEKYVLYSSGDNAKGKDSFNLHGIAVLLDGNYQEEKPTDAQKQTLAKFIANFRKKHPGNWYVRGHKEVSITATSCPGTNIGTSKSGWLKDVIKFSDIVLNPVTPPVVVPPVVTPPIEPPVVTPPTEPPPVEKMIQVKEKDWKDKNQEVVDLTSEVKALKDIIKERNLTIGGVNGNEGLRGELMEAQTARDKAISDAKNMAAEVKTTYDPEQKWGDQHWQFQASVAKLVTANLKTWAIFNILIQRLFNLEKQT